MAVTEFAFSVDDFKNPKSFKNPEAVSTLLIRLLLLEPGTLQSHPEAGLGLYSRYSYSTEGTALKLQGEYQSQIERFLPQFQGARVTVKEKNKTFRISVEIDNTMYAISYDIDTKDIKSNYVKVSDL